MNGRIYDPTLGRFLQADPHIQAPHNSQNYNRYSYVLNNPLSYTDPSGYFFKALGKFVKKHWRTIVAIGIAWWNPGALLFDSVWAASAATGFVAGGVSTGSLKGALIGAFSGAAFGGLHGFDPGVGKTLLHGVVGGIGSVLSGGKFGHGFLSAGLTQGFSGKINGISTKLGRIIASSVLGGTVSEITGGKFSNGAITAAFSRALNDEGTSKTEEGCEDCYPFGKEAQEALESPITDEQALAEEEGWSQLAKNKFNGATAEQKTRDWYIKNNDGAVVQIHGVTLSVNGELRFPDLIVQNADGSFQFIEVKAGLARLSPRQVRLDRIIQTQGAIVITSNTGLIPLGQIPPTNVDLIRMVFVPD